MSDYKYLSHNANPGDVPLRSLKDTYKDANPTMVTDWTTIALVTAATYAVTSYVLQPAYAVMATSAVGIYAYTTTPMRSLTVDARSLHQKGKAKPNHAAQAATLRAMGGATRHPSVAPPI